MRAGGERVEEMGPLFPLPAPALPIEDVQEEETGGPYTRGTDDNEMDIEHEFDEFDEPTEMTQDGDEEEDEETQLEAEELDVTVIAYPFTDPPLTDFFGDSLESSECYAIYLPGTDSKWFLWMGRSSEVSEEELVAAFRQYCAAELESHVEEEAGGERRHPGGRERRRAAESAEVVEEGNEPDVLLLALD